jgi:adenylyl- and sulfurtransferase ThiI
VEIPPANVATVRVVRRGVNVYTVHCIFTPQVVLTASEVQYLYSFWERCTTTFFAWFLL